MVALVTQPRPVTFIADFHRRDFHLSTQVNVNMSDKRRERETREKRDAAREEEEEDDDEREEEEGGACRRRAGGRWTRTVRASRGLTVVPGWRVCDMLQVTRLRISRSVATPSTRTVAWARPRCVSCVVRRVVVGRG
jgi:hypothetical protein